MITLKTASPWGLWNNTTRAPTDIYVDDSGYVIGAGGVSGRIVKYSESGTILYSSPGLGKNLYAGDLTLYGMYIDGVKHIVSAGYYFTDALLYRDSGLSFTRPTELNGGQDLSMVSDMEAYQIGSKTYFYSVSRKDANIEIWEANISGNWKKIGAVSSSEWNQAGSVPKIEIINGNLYAISQENNSITSYSIGANGGLSEKEVIDPTGGLLVSRPSDFVSFEQNGKYYLCIASNKSSSLSLVELDGRGGMKVVDQVNDRTDTFFDSANIVRHFSVDGMSYLVVSGGDKGISIYTLLPNGRLHHVSSIADTQDLTLNGISDIEVKVNGGQVKILVSSLSENGVSELNFDLSEKGVITSSSDAKVWGTAKKDILTYTGENGTLYGGAGDDILIGGSGLTLLYGGEGADTFYVNGKDTHVRDFTLGEDKIDISGWGIKSGDTITIRPVSRGAVVQYGDNILRIQTNDQTRINMNDFGYTDLFTESRADVENTPDLIVDAGDDISNGIEVYPGVRLNIGRAGEASLVEGYTGNDIIYGDDVDEAYNETAGQLVRMYQSAVGRPPDKAGFSYWIDKLQNGMPIEKVVGFFINSPEYTSRYGVTNNYEYIVKLYQNSLGRSPDVNGMNYWKKLLDKNPGMRLEMFMFFANSQELRMKTIDLSCDFSSVNLQSSWSDNIYRLYKSILGRDPDLGGVRYWSKYLLKGGDYNKVIGFFLRSDEYMSTYGGTDDVDFLRLIYQNVQGREPDQSGYNFWLNALSNGLSRSDLVRYTVDSKEYIEKSTPQLTEWSRKFAQDDVLNGKGGNDIFVGGIFSDTFVFEKGRAGVSKIYGFEAWDKIELNNTDYQTLQEVLDDFVAYNGGIKLSLGDQDILLSGLTMDDLSPENIVLG